MTAPRLLTALVLLAAACPLSAVTIDLDALPLLRETPLSAEYLADPSAKLGWREAANPTTEFQPLSGKVQSFGVVPGAMWFRTTIKREQQLKPFVLVAWGTLLNHVDVWFLDPEGNLIENYRSGDSVEPDKRLPQSLAFEFPVPISSEVTVLIRIATQGSLVFQMYLWERDALTRNLEFQNLLLGLIFGFLLLMVVINVLFRVGLKDNRFLWYSVYVAGLAFFLMVYTGWLRFLLLPNRFPQDFWDVGSLGLLIVAAIWFCRKANRLHLVAGNQVYCLVLTGLAGAGTLLGLVGLKDLGLLVLNAALLLMIIGCWGFVFVQARRGSRFSRFFLGAWSLPLVSGLLLVIQALFASNWDGFNPYYLLVGGILVETLILSFAFSDEVHQWHQNVLVKLSENYKQDRLITLGMVASRVGHEINTPNHVIALNLASLETLGKKHVEHRERDEDEWTALWAPVFQSLREASRQIGFVVGQLLLDRKSPAASPVLCDLAEVADQVWTLHRVRWESRTTKWSWPDSPSGARVLGNPFRLQQLLVNLVDNAVQSLDGEGSVKIRVSVEKGQALLTIIDDGKGMDKEEIAQLGEPFFSTKKESGGHGLGWGICQEVAREHLGLLIIDSAPGEGTKITLKIPLPS